MKNAPSDEAKKALAPGGKLRVGINHSNFLLVNAGSPHGAPKGIAADLGAELARRLGAQCEYVSFDSAGKTADGAKAGLWDVAFLGAEPQRANEIAFTAAYLEIPVTFLVPAGSPIRGIAEVDREGVRIAVSGKSAYDLFLTRTLKHAKLHRAEGIPASFELFKSERLEAMAGLRPGLIGNAEKLPGARVLDGQITAVQQAIGTPKSRSGAAAAWLRGFAEDIKASGLVAGAIEKHGVRGVTVAPPAA
jgi:polar amino acid transport system substrate-binding protein